MLSLKALLANSESTGNIVFPATPCFSSDRCLLKPKGKITIRQILECAPQKNIPMLFLSLPLAVEDAS